ncbi:MAG: nucleotidyltransferase domain-containing protein [Candidatus Woesearchaeota archaeon]
MCWKMILNRLLKSQELKSTIKAFKNRDVFDIVIYGSVVRGKEDANDIDIAIIMNRQTSAGEKLEISANLREKLEIPGMEIDVKAIDIKDLQDPAFIARQPILAEGYSLISEEFLHKIFGFRAYYAFAYSPKSLTYSQKKTLYYALKGRRGGKGLLQQKGGEQTGACRIRVPIQAAEEFKSIFEQHNAEYRTETEIVF